MRSHCNRNKEKERHGSTTQACRSKQRPGYHEEPQNKAYQITIRLPKKKWRVN